MVLIFICKMLRFEPKDPQPDPETKHFRDAGPGTGYVYNEFRFATLLKIYIKCWFNLVGRFGGWGGYNVH